jgi:hypothetical protein
MGREGSGEWWGKRPSRAVQFLNTTREPTTLLGSRRCCQFPSKANSRRQFSDRIYMTSRREFLRNTGVAAAIAAANSALSPAFSRAFAAQPVFPRGYSTFVELPIKDLLADALSAA